MKSKTVGVTKPVYDLCKVIEERELTLDFSCFYSFEEILESHHYCPGWEFNLQYYEIQYDEYDRLQVLMFPFRGHMGDEGQILTEEQIVELTENMKSENY